MREFYEEHIEEGLRRVGQFALEEWKDEPINQLQGVLRNINFLEQSLNLEDMDMFMHLLSRTKSPVKFYPHWLHIQRIASQIKMVESPHFAIQSDLREVVLWKPHTGIENPYAQTSPDDLLALNKNPYYGPLFSYFGGQTFMQLADQLHSNGVKLLRKPNLLASL